MLVTRTMLLGLAFQSDKSPAQYRALAEIVDRYPFGVVSVYNDLLYQPALGPLLWMAPALHHAQIGPAALNPFTIHPVEIAGQIALLDLASGGRAYLGLVRGAWLDRIGVVQSRPVQTLRETTRLIQHLLAGRTEPFCGEIFRHPANAPLRYARVRDKVPVTIGTWGPATARMAGEVADEIKIGGSANPAMIGVLKPYLDQGCSVAGRRDQTVRICLGAVSVVDADRQAARRLARREVAHYLTVVARLDPTSDPEWLARIEAADARGDMDAIVRDISDEALDRFAFAGSPADLVRQVEILADAGAGRVEFGTPHGADPAAAIRLLGEQVVPAFR
jgi:5,10-methylenetetrahydromethanopterin reductase